MPLLLLATLAALAPAPRPGAPDTTVVVDVRRGQRLEIQGHTGNVTIRTWARAAVRIEAERDELPGIDARGATLRLDAGPGRDRRGDGDLALTVPAAMDVRINVIDGTIDLQGLTGAIEAESVNGDVLVRGGTGVVSLRTVSGNVEASGARGKIELNSVNGHVRATDLEGTVTAETVNDEVTLRGIRSDDVVMTSVSGDVHYEGSIVATGRYRFGTHSGDCTVVLPAGAGAVLDVSTYSGEFESEVPVQLSEKRGKRFSGTLGGGGARLDLESFSGSIRLVRADPRRAP